MADLKQRSHPDAESKKLQPFQIAEKANCSDGGKHYICTGKLIAL
jgi:hypothetical protein